MRYYEIGEVNTLNSEDVVRDLKNRFSIAERLGVDVWELHYTKLCNHIRRQFGFNNYIMLRLPTDPENQNKEHFGVSIFELEVDPDNHKIYKVQFEEGTNKLYIEEE